MHNPSGIFEFVGVGEIAETTIQLLSFNLREPLGAALSKGGEKSGIEQVEQLIFQQARDYLSKVREGFVLSVRSSDIPDTYQLRYLLDRVLFDWDAISDELGLEVDDESPQPSSEIATSGQPASPDPARQGESVEPAMPVEPVRQQLLAFGMAVVALGALPKLPSEQVTFPHSYGNPPTYADISAPSSPAEMLIRIEELEEMIWQMMSGNPGDLVQSKYGPVRRTYGFFETSAWLVRKDAECFGIKKNATAPLTFF